MAKWTQEVLHRKLVELGVFSLSKVMALTANDNGTVMAWSNRDYRNPVIVPKSTVDILVNSTKFDNDLYFTLVDVVGIDPAVAARMCLDG